ncbi:pyridoxal phosphate-dependent decarboxylase family protein [Halocatena pleomorpha]|uniref:Aspartate aminotransferase family protein n=1 Tax=Halocatena pleomorpha TaxID=1785090 RepID=A0A3P3R5U2_9EURY|nr:aspartate aminotransferase family protein [Halocatena pleomorpha]RRJ28259.1 aspartate aminotransferase family protein [Halocatena pleomorpha]
MSRTDAPERERTAGLFLGSDTTPAYRTAMEQAYRAVTDVYLERATPYTGRSPEQLAAQFEDHDVLPENGQGVTETIETVAQTVVANSVGTSDPACVAHLQCPPMIPALAAEVLISATNQSLDSWDQAPAATELETRLIEALAGVFGYGDDADGVFTSGGTQSNFMGLLLARNWVLDERFDHDAQADGLPPAADSLRILCSADAHFTARQAAAQLGLGERAIVSIPTDEHHRLSIDALDSTLAELAADDCEPFALIGTAGTTDFGSIDPLAKLGAHAREHDLWFHVDAAYGGALALSDRHREKLRGIEMADSIAVDFHKLFYQPLSCGAFLLGDGTHYQYIDRNAEYLNPESDDAAHLVSKSVQTSRRFDALKPYIAFRTLGRDGFEELIDYTLDLTTAVAQRIKDDPAFELKHEPTLNAVVFRYRPPTNAETAINDRIRDRLRAAGTAMIARTTVDGEPCLKFTLLNPRTTVETIEDVLTAIKRHGSALSTGERTTRGVEQ